MPAHRPRSRRRATSKKPGRSGVARKPARSSGSDFLYGLHPVHEALRAGRRQPIRLLIRMGPARAELEPVVEAARAAGVPMSQVEADELLQLTGGTESNLQGVVLEAGPLPELRTVEALAEEPGRAPGGRLLVALDGVEDPQNVGAIVRVAEAAGASGLLMTERRAPPLSPALARASAGAIVWLPVARVSNLGWGLEPLQRCGFWLVGADPDARDSLYELPDRLLTGDLVVVLGAEGPGLRASVRAALDHPVRIPMMGRVASMNVATAGAVILFELLRRSKSGLDG
jgi:23S rRNA (guanosine2251-2'-O)-methyltransferase